MLDLFSNLKFASLAPLVPCLLLALPVVAAPAAAPAGGKAKATAPVAPPSTDPHGAAPASSHGGAAVSATTASAASPQAGAQPTDAAPDPVEVAGLACLTAKTPEARRAAATNVRSAGKSALGLELGKDCPSAVTNLCAAAAAGQVKDPSVLRDHSGECVRYRAASTTTAPAAVGAEIVRSLAQVVVTKAQAAGWGLLKERLEELAQCLDNDGNPVTAPKFAETCKTLGSLSIKDLVSSPEVLLDAVVEDLLNLADPQVTQALGDKKGIVALALHEVAMRWPQSGASGIPKGLSEIVLDYIEKNANGVCAEQPRLLSKYGILVGRCIIEKGANDLDTCNVQPLIDDCYANETDAEKKAQGEQDLRRLWDVTAPVFKDKAKPIDIVNLIFALGQEELNETSPQDTEAARYLSGAKDLVSGLVTKDWVEATSGAVVIIGVLETKAEASKAPDAAQSAEALKHFARLFQVLAAVGNYALTFDPQKNPDSKDAQAARDKIITELVDRMVNRTDRESGAVVSLGGTLGAYGGYRFARVAGKISGDFAFPVQLTLGVGVQTYAAKDGGFHLLVSAVDLGQYVNMNTDGNLQVGEPDLKSALALGLAAGGWFALRETPLHIALQGSVAPFNRAGQKPTFQAGLVAGVYVPLLDFN